MAVYKKNNKFISYLLILISLFILILFTKGEIISLQENIDLGQTYNNQLDEKKGELEVLNEIKKKLESDSIDLDKYNVEIKEDELIDYIYGYIENTNSEDSITVVNSISINKAVKTEIGFMESTINLNLRVSDYKRLEKILNFLVSDKSKYKFFISSFSYAYDDNIRDFSVNIPLKVLYK